VTLHTARSSANGETEDELEVRVNLLEEKIGTMVAIKNVLFATDFSDVSEAALPYVTALSLRYGSTVHVVHVLPEVAILPSAAPDPATFGLIYEEVHSGAQEKIQQLSKRLKGFPHKTYVRHGEVLDVVKHMVEEQEIDLLVLGTHGRTGLGKLLMGSVAEQIFRQANCPVLTVGPGVPPTEKVRESRHDRDLRPVQVKFGNILYATDFKPDAVEGSSYAVSLAREFQAHLTLLHVIDDFGENLHDHPGPIDTALAKLEELVSDREGLRYVPEFVAEYGSPAELILKIANEYEADLIILGVRPTSSSSAVTHFGRSVAHKVVAGANCPVLTIRR
jgi:nucleotide-binding universal stress UspA family protein